MALLFNLSYELHFQLPLALSDDEDGHLRCGFERGGMWGLSILLFVFCFFVEVSVFSFFLFGFLESFF